MPDTRVSSALLLGSLCAALGAFPGSARAAPTAAPPRSYPPPPPRVAGTPPPFDYPFTPAVAAAPDPDDDRPAGHDYRGFNLTLAVGPGGLFGPGEDALALSYLPFRVGFGIDRDLMLVVGFEGVGTNSVNPKTLEDSWLYQDIWSLGVQGRLGFVYLRGAIGRGGVAETTKSETFSGGHGLSVLGAIGAEIFERDHVALALELNGSHTRYPSESWQTMGVQLAVTFF